MVAPNVATSHYREAIESSALRLVRRNRERGSCAMRRTLEVQGMALLSHIPYHR
jgi:hypothetical protein